MRRFLSNFLWQSLVVLALAGMACKARSSTTSNLQGSFGCTPCGAACDTARYDKPGTCLHCNMKLVKVAGIRQQAIEPEEVCSFIAKVGEEKVLLLDVRTVGEFEGTAKGRYGKLKGAVNIPIQQLEQRMGELDAWKDKKIIVYCSHSGRSPRAAYMLTTNGFKQVINMNGGMSVWKSRVTDDACNREIFIDHTN